ncbi:MAG: maleylpyruvate isomerase family mycothiol-dependent enzyme [Actinomycetota bacterium]
MEIAEHITAVGREAKLLAEAAKQGGLDVDVPTCPGWDMRELLRHLSMIHLWAAGHVAQLHDGSWGDDLPELTEFWPDLAVFWPDDDMLIDWYLETNANLVRTLESAPLDVESWTFLPAPSPLAMWARRQAHETAVHRFDAQNAAGNPGRFNPAFASDGIDELLVGFAPRRKEFPIASARTMVVHATDTDDRWHLTLTPEGITTMRGDGPADVTLTGDASDLYLALWNRAEDSTITVTGDREPLDKWRDNMKVRWS